MDGHKRLTLYITPVPWYNRTMTTTTPPSAALRVAAGVLWLDANVPNWVERVSLPKFNFEDTCGCVLGQIFARLDKDPSGKVVQVGGFEWAVWDENLLTREESWHYGFDAWGNESTDRDEDSDKWMPWIEADIWELEYNSLQDEWLKVIRERKDA